MRLVKIPKLTYNKTLKISGMDIFNGNRKLEEAIMYSMDWGVFLRDTFNEPLQPFMFLFNGEEMLTRILMTDDDPVEYAKIVLAGEENPFQQFVIGTEGYMKDGKGQKVNAIVVHGFDKTQAEGIVLGQIFKSKKDNSAFEKIDKVTFLGHRDLIIDKENIDNLDYGIEEVGFNGVTMEDGTLIAFLTHTNPSAVANTIKRYIRAKLTGKNFSSFNGKFEFQITPGLIRNNDFLKYLILNVVEEERNAAVAVAWEKLTNREILFKVKHGDLEYLSELKNGKVATNKSKSNSTVGLKFSSLSHLKWKSMMITNKALVLSTKKYTSLEAMSKNITGINVGEDREEFWYRSLEEINYLSSGENLSLKKLNFRQAIVSETINLFDLELINELIKAMSVEYNFTKTEEKAGTFNVIRNPLLLVVIAFIATSGLFWMTSSSALGSLLVLIIGGLFILFFLYKMIQIMRSPPALIRMKRVKEKN